MSLIAHRNLKAVKLLAATGRTERASVALAITAIVSPVQKAIMQGARLFSHAVQALAEARMQRAAIEAELYLNRYIHSSKNDDDLPIVQNRPRVVTQTARRSSFDRRSTNERPYASGHGSASRHRAYVVLLTFALLAAVFAAIIALRVAVWLPAFYH